MRYEHPKGDRCFVCGRMLGKAKRVDTRDDQKPFVGPDCYLHIVNAHPNGWQPPSGGPVLYLCDDDPDFNYVLDHRKAVR